MIESFANGWDFPATDAREADIDAGGYEMGVDSKGRPCRVAYHSAANSLYQLNPKQGLRASGNKYTRIH